MKDLEDLITAMDAGEQALSIPVVMDDGSQIQVIPLDGGGYMFGTDFWGGHWQGDLSEAEKARIAAAIETA